MPSQKQKTPTRWLSFLPGIVLAAVVVIGLAFILRSLPGPIPTGQVAVSLIETPTTPVVETLPADESNVIVLPPVEVSSQWTPTPTWTPYPTWTPRPTPTRRPGPTATPFPTRAPASDAAGMIFYVVQEPAQTEDTPRKNLVYHLPVGTQAEKLAEATQISIPQLDIFANVMPSPDDTAGLSFNHITKWCCYA